MFGLDLIDFTMICCLPKDNALDLEVTMKRHVEILIC